MIGRGHVTWIMTFNWSRVITWPGFWPLIGRWYPGPGSPTDLYFLSPLSIISFPKEAITMMKYLMLFSIWKTVGKNNISFKRKRQIKISNIFICQGLQTINQPASDASGAKLLRGLKILFPDSWSFKMSWKMSSKCLYQNNVESWECPRNEYFAVKLILILWI